MLNQSIIVGRLVKDCEIKKLENDRKITAITIAVPRSYKNENGEYDTDFIDCQLYPGIAENVIEYCRKGDLLGIKGRLQTANIADDDGNIISKGMVLVAEKVTFLSSNNKNVEEK